MKKGEREKKKKDIERKKKVRKKHVPFWLEEINAITKGRTEKSPPGGRK